MFTTTSKSVLSRARVGLLGLRALKLRAALRRTKVVHLFRCFIDGPDESNWNGSTKIKGEKIDAANGRFFKYALSENLAQE